MRDVLKLTCGNPKYEKKSILFNRIILILSFIFVISFFINKLLNIYLRFIPLILLIIIYIIPRKYFKYNATGEITFFEDHVLILNDEKEISINYSDTKKIVFILSSTRPYENGIYPVDSFDNKLRIFTEENYEYEFYCDEDKIEQIRLFVKEYKSTYNFSIQRTLHDLNLD